MHLLRTSQGTYVNLFPSSLLTINMSGNDLLLLLERPKEPVFIAKGEQKAVFDVPDKFVVNTRFFLF